MSSTLQIPVDERMGLTLAEPVLLTEKKPEPIAVAARRLWWALALACVVGGSLGIAAALSLPAWYESTSTFAVLPVDDPTAPSQFDSSGTAPPLFSHVLTSRRVADQVVAQLQLTKVYGTRSPHEARLELLKHVVVWIDRKANVVTLSVEDKLPARARAIAQAIGDVAREVSGEIWSAKSTEHRKRLEVRLAEVSKSLNAAEEAMRLFREKENVVDLPEQIKASVGEAAFLARVKNEKRIGLHFAQSFGGADSPEVRRGQLEAGSANAALQGLVHGAQPGPLLALDNLPRLQAEHARLKRDIDTNNSLYEVLVRQVEQVRAVEARPGGRVELVDAPAEPLNRARPSRIAWAFEGAFLGLMLSLLFILWPRLQFAAGQMKFPWARSEPTQ